MNARPWPRTDIGTIVLHWLAAGATVVLLLSGLRFAADDVGHDWLRAYDGWLLSDDLWIVHVVAGYVLTMAAVSYALYLRNGRLFSRIRLDRARLRGLFGSPRLRWSGLHVLGVWVFLVAAAGLIVTGWLAYFGAAEPVLQIHLYCTWAVLGFIPAHLFALLQLGGIPEIVRVFRPKRGPSGAGEVDLASVVSDLLAERGGLREPGGPGGRASDGPDPGTRGQGPGGDEALVPPRVRRRRIG